MIQPLIPKNQFTGLDGIAHFATGGESPTLRSHQLAVQQFLEDKSRGEPARQLQADVMEQARQRCAQLFKVPAQDITFLSSATEGINVVRYGIEWQAGDNVVVADIEFPSDVLPWTTLQDRGVEIRVVKHDQWVIDEQAILDQVNERTRVVAISQVSMYTGQHMDVTRLSQGVRDAGALFLLDTTHAAGVVPVDAKHADIMVCSCYKWLLGTHGTAVFYWNREKLPLLSPPFIGWASVATSGGWQSPLDFTLPEHADRFLPANPSYISLYVLNNGLQQLLLLGEDKIQRHSLALGKLIQDGLIELGLEMMTPTQERKRAGNVCFMIENVEALRSSLADKGVLVWGAYGRFGRVRVSAHVHNDGDDVSRLIDAIKNVTLRPSTIHHQY